MLSRTSRSTGYIGTGRCYDFVTHEPVLAEMGGKRRARPARYRGYVETGLAETDKEFEEIMKSSPRSIGGEGFRAWVNELYGKLVKEYKTAEDAVFRNVIAPLDVETVLGVVGRELGAKKEDFLCRRRDSVLRAVAAHYLLRYAGKSQREVAMVLQAGGGSSISKQLNRYRDVFKSAGMNSSMERIDKRLAEERRRQ